ncbi:DUF4158 domain-containing protein [Laceyella putida]|uniref:DUF4158 domain-containing protein n=1 Tax=Laceyella putida TaxID=110101 RepID=A0ABW2REZ4_9BACL
MKQQLTKEELIEHFTLLPPERQLVEEKNLDSQLGFAVLFKCFQNEARFPESAEDVPFPVIKFLANQLRTSTDQFYQYSWTGRSIKRHRVQIRKHFGECVVLIGPLTEQRLEICLKFSISVQTTQNISQLSKHWT